MNKCPNCGSGSTAAVKEDGVVEYEYCRECTCAWTPGYTEAQERRKVADRAIEMIKTAKGRNETN